VIGADGKDVAASIAFTAVLGVLVVLGLPLLVPLLRLSETQYGVLAGLTVYAVPQVLAATAPVAAASVQIGTLVKLVRVLMLGPVVLALSVFGHRLREDSTEGNAKPAPRRLAVNKLVPWFIIAFLGMAALRSHGVIPEVALAPIAKTATILTIISMAALGLGVDIRVVARADNHLVLGIQAVGQGVSELSAAFGLAIEMGARLEDIAGTIHAHPTLGEAVQESALKALGHALHI